MEQGLFLESWGGKERKRIPRAELWIGSDVFGTLGLQDNIQARFMLCSELRMDCLFLPLSLGEKITRPPMYRSFTISEIKENIEERNLPLGIILDGPFQCLCQKWGVVRTLSLLDDPGKFLAAEGMVLVKAAG